MMDPRILAGVGGLSLLVGALGGWQVRSWRCEAQIAKIERAAIEAQEVSRAQMEAAATDYEQFRAGNETAEVRTQTQIREVFRNVPVPTDCAVPDDVVRLLDSAREAANGSASSQSGGTVQGD